MPDTQMALMMNREVRKHYAAIGNVAVEWTRFKRYLSEMVQMLAGVNGKFGECIIAEISDVERILDALSALSNLRSPGIARDRDFQKRLSSIRSLDDRCREVIHDLWTFDPGTATRWPTAIRDGCRQDPVPMQTDEVEAIALEIENVSQEFLTFRRELLVSLNLWPGQ
jgi:spore cortex formation protein SpoVR/YcgB (stage V sporulation)